MADLICLLAFALAVAVWYFARLRGVREAAGINDTDLLDVVPDQVDVTTVALVVLRIT